MSDQAVHEQPALPAGTYYLAVLLVGDDKLCGQTLRLHWPEPMQPSQLGTVTGDNASALVPDELAGAAPGMWWVFQATVIDAWARVACVAQQVSVDRSLVREELAGELGRIAPETFSSIGERLVKMLTTPTQRGLTDAHWPSSTASH